MMIFLAAAAEHPNALEALSKTFGLHGAFFVAQVVNFFLVILVLKKFAFGPIQQMLEQRRARIIAGEEKLKQIEKQLAESSPPLRRPSRKPMKMRFVLSMRQKRAQQPSPSRKPKKPYPKPSKFSPRQKLRQTLTVSVLRLN